MEGAIFYTRKSHRKKIDCKTMNLYFFLICIKYFMEKNLKEVSKN